MRQVSETRALHVLIRDLDNKLNAQRFPTQIFARAPSRLTSGHAAAGLCLVALPVSPRMLAQSIFAIRRKKLDKLFAFGSGEAGTDSDVLKLPRIIVQAQ